MCRCGTARSYRGRRCRDRRRVGATIDTTHFLHAAHTLLAGRWLETFGRPGLQAGPLEVAGIGAAAGKLGEAVGVSALRAVCVLQSAVLTAVVMTGAAVLAGSGRRWIAPATGLVALATGTVAVVAGLYGPFVLLGPFAMLDYHWQIASGTLPAALGFGPSFGWALRLVQGALAGLVGAGACLLLRRRGSVCWLAPMLMLWMKVGLDPGRGAWYLLAPQTTALLGAAYVAGSAWLATVGRGESRDRAALTLKPGRIAADR